MIDLKNKILVSTLFILLAMSLSVQAQQPQFDLQKMMQMQSCIAKLDRQALEQFGQEAKDMQSKLQSMCRAGQRSEAQTTAMGFAMDMMQNETLQQARQCGEMVKHMMPAFNFPTKEEDLKGRHVCDEI